jgi:tRNA threonylcarbamoyladenosine biosynthesis protein TsaB
MIILSIRTDKPESEIGLFEDHRQLTYETWPAHRQLAETMHGKIERLLESQGRTWTDIGGVVCYQGPGSFTGLRIGLSVGNALAYSYGIPIVAAQDPAWLETGIVRLMNNENDNQALPFYGTDAHITLPKK